MPNELTETDIIERFGWTFSELDNEDEDRVYTGVGLQNIRDSVNRIRGWVSGGGKGHIGNEDLELWGELMNAEKELNG